MSVVVVGLQHKQAPLPLLEAVAIPDVDLHKILGRLRDRRNVQETVVLSTCLRTEIYAVVDRFHDAVAEIYDVLHDYADVSIEELEGHAVIRFDDDVTRHLFAVASGLESAVVGESEVVGQVRRAFEYAQEEGACGPVLSALFRHALQTGKRVRTETGIARGTTSFAYAAVDVTRQQLARPMGESTVVVVGAGEMGTGVCRAVSGLADAPSKVVVVNRSRERADALLGDAGAPSTWRSAALENVHAELAKADVVLCAVAADAHVLIPAHFSGVAGPLLVVDLGMPRNVDPAVASLPAVTLLDMDTLSARVAQAIGDRQEEAVEAQRIIDEEVDRYRAASRQRGAAPIIAALRARLESLRETELERHRAQLADLSEAEWEQVDQATRAAMSKLLHEPTMILKETAGTPQGERLVEALRILFDL